MHRWGDAGVDWKGINDAADWIRDQLTKWGRINVTDAKEKFGTVRVYCTFGWYQFHSITHPRDSYCRYPRWLWNLDCRYGQYFLWPTFWPAEIYHRWLYRKTYQRALRKWPHLREEILSGADHVEYLRSL